MAVRTIEAKTLLSSHKTPDSWFGIKYTMNLYRGCQHHCIYCDSRSECYGIADFDGEVLVKTNAVELLDRELRSKRVKGYVSTGAMNDPYMPVERRLELTRRVLSILAARRFPVHVMTKSDLVLRDLDLLAAIEAACSGVTPGVVVSITITCADDALARQIEPAAPSPSARLPNWLRTASAPACCSCRCSPSLRTIPKTSGRS
jgi:DNA repair photolyase